MSSVVEVGIRINIDGSRASADAVNQVAAQTVRLSEDAKNANRSVTDMMRQVSAQITNASRTISASGDETSAAVKRVQGSMQSATKTSGAYFDSMTLQWVNPEPLNKVAQGVDKIGVSAKQTAAAMRGVPAQLTDIVVALQGGQNPLTVFLQQGGQLKDMFGSAGAAARSLSQYVIGLINPFTVAAAAAGVLALGYYQGTQEASAFNAAIINTGNAAGVTRSQLSSMSAQVAANANVTKGAAAEVITALVASGRVGQENLVQFATVAEQANKRLGVEIETTVSSIESLAKSPLEGAKKLNETYRFLTAATYEQISALTLRGQTEEAANVAQQAYFDTLSRRSADAQQDLGVIERLWGGIKDMAKSAGDAIKNIGRDGGLQGQLASVQASIATARQGLAGNNENDSGLGPLGRLLITSAKERLQVLLDEEAVLQSRLKLEQQTAAHEAEIARQTEAGTKWVDLKNQHLTKQKQLELEIERATNTAKTAGISVDDDAFKAVIAKIREKYSDLNNVTIAQLEAGRALQKQSYAESLADLESSHKRLQVSETQYITAKRDLQVKDLDSEIAYTKRLADLAKGKEDQSEYRKLIGQIQVLQAQRAAAYRQADRSIEESAAAMTRVVTDQARNWATATQSEIEQLEIETDTFGQVAQARSIAVNQAKVDADVRQILANAQKEGHTLSKQDIDDLYASADARKRNIASIEGERQARAGAEQLLQENRRFAAESIADEVARSARLLEIDADMWRQRIALAGDGTDAQRSLQEQFDQWYANRQLGATIDRWKGVVSNLDTDFRNGFRSMLEHGHDAWGSFSKAIGNTLKTTLADVLFETFAKKYVLQVVTSLANLFSGQEVASALAGNGVSAAGASGGGGDAVSTAMSAASLYKLVSGGFNAIGSSIANGAANAGSWLYGQGFETLGTTVGTNAALLGRLGTTAAGYGVGSALNSAISGQYQVGSGFQTAEKVATAVASYINPLLGSAVGAISGLINRAFGMGPQQVTSAGLRGSISDAGVSGQNYANWHQDGGWFRSDRNGTNTTSFDAALTKQFADGFASIKAASTSAAAALGVSASAIADYSRAFDITLSKDATANEQAITDLFQSMSDEIAARLVPSILDFQKSGETSSVTLQRLAQDFATTDQVARVLGQSAGKLFGSIGLDSATARERLIDLSGGVQNLSAQATFFAQNFLTAEERLAPVTAALNDAMASLGLSGVTTREQFKSVVQGLDLTTEAGAKQFAAMMNLQEAFAQVHPVTEAVTQDMTAANEALRQQQDLREQLNKLTLSEGELRARQYDLTNESTKALYDQVLAAEAARDASAAAIEAAREASASAAAATAKLAEVNRSWQDRIDSFLISQMDVAKQRELELSTMDESTTALARRYYALIDEKDAADAAVKASQEAAKVAQAEAEAKAKADQAEAERAAQITAQWTAAFYNASVGVGQVASVTESAVQQMVDLTAQRASMELRLYELTHSAAETLAHKRELELAAIDSTLRPLQEQIYAQEDLANAADAAARRISAIAGERMGLERQLYQVQGDTAKLRQLELEQLDVGNREIQQQIWAIQDKQAADQAAAAAAQAIAQAQAQAAAAAAQEAKRVADEQARAAKELADAWSNATNSIFDEVARIRGLDSSLNSDSAASTEARFQIALAQARAGDLTAQQALPQLAQTLTQLLKESAASDFELRSGLARIAGSLEQVGSSSVARLGLKLPSFDVGADYLPRNMVAMVHEGEGILTKSENAAFSSFISDPGSMMAGVVAAIERMRQDGKEAHSKDTEKMKDMLELLRAIATGSIDARDMFSRWEAIGMPPVRTEEAV